MKILRLEIENFLRVVTFNHTPVTALVQVTGPNASGKTSSLAAIGALLYGAGELKRSPVHTGADEARIRAWIGNTETELIVTRTVQPDRTSRLTIKHADGTKYAGSPQAILDALIDAHSIDALEFDRAKPAEQRAMLGKILGIDAPLAVIATNRERVFAKRTEVSRTGRELQARIDAMPLIDDALEPVNVPALLDELKHRDEANRTVTFTVTRIKSLYAEVGALQDKIADALRRIDAWKADGMGKLAEIETLERQQIDEDNTEPLRQQIVLAQAINAACATRTERVALLAQRSGVHEVEESLTQDIADIDAEKFALLASVRMPVDGLGLQPDHVTFNGHPLDQSSDAQRLRVSLKIAMARQPQLRVIRVRQGNLLDRASLALVEAEIAGTGHNDDWQMWMEKVSDTKDIGIVMQDGEIVANNYATLPSPNISSDPELPWDDAAEAQ